MWKGIDVSDNQGVIDWAQVAASKVAFGNLGAVCADRARKIISLLQIWKAAESTAFR